MKTVTYVQNGAEQLGILVGNTVYDAQKTAAAAGLTGDFQSLRRVLEQPEGLESLKRAAASLESAKTVGIPLETLTLLAPVTDPPKVLGAALNYRDFCARGNLPVPEKLKVFGKYATAVNRPEGTVDIQGRKVTYEGELAIVIGRPCRGAAPENALSFVAGYTAVNDCTANDYTKEDVQLLRGKNLDGFLPMGPVFVTADEIGDAGKLHIRTVVDGEVRQDSCTDQLIFGIPELICYFSAFMTLMPGDVIASGTPAGTALQFDPPRFLRPGQTVSVTVEKIGTLTSRIVSSV